jgi:saccharopine dehydrogenase-like NADP-dependent oxidoreductase
MGGKVNIVPRRLMSDVFKEKFAGDEPDLVIMRVEAHVKDRVAAFSVVDHYDRSTKMTAMMRTTAWPASIVVQMLASGVITKRGGIRQELDVPAEPFIEEMGARGVRIDFNQYTAAQRMQAAPQKRTALSGTQRRHARRDPARARLGRTASQCRHGWLLGSVE